MFKRTVGKTAAIVAVLSVSLALGAAGSASAAPKQILNVGFNGSPDTLDPQKTSGTITFQILKSVYDTLLEPDTSGHLVSALAESWTVSSDGLSVVFKLRKGVVFHNGDTLTAKDVKATLDRIRNAATASPSATEYSVITGITTPDDYTVKLSLSRPSAPILSTLASGWSAILPKSLIDKNWDFANKPVGTGPFIFKEWIRDSRIKLEKNPKYWIKGQPRLEAITFQIIPESSIVVQGLLSGSLDLYDGLKDSDLEVLAKSSEIRIQPQLTSIVNVIAINTSRPALKDVRVRKALSWAIDRQKALDYAYGKGRITTTFHEPNDPYYKDFSSLQGWDPKKAHALLVAAGFDFNQTLDLSVSSLYEAHVKATQIFQQDLLAAGVKTKIRVVEWATWLSDIYKGGNFDLTVIGHTGKLDPSGRLQGYGTDKVYVKWINPEVASLIEKGERVTDFAQRKQIYDRVFELFAKEAPFIYIGAPVSNAALRKNVAGFVKTPKLDSYDFRLTEKK